MRSIRERIISCFLATWFRDLIEDLWTCLEFGKSRTTEILSSFQFFANIDSFDYLSFFEWTSESSTIANILNFYETVITVVIGEVDYIMDLILLARLACCQVYKHLWILNES